MPQNKSHHFVPRFYLRYFTTDGKRIDLFNISHKRFIRNAPLKGQCCRDYFYGKNIEHEQGLAETEGQTAELFRLIFGERRLPRPFTAGHVLLCFHIVTQANRTLSAANTLNELIDGMWKEILKHDPKAPQEGLQDVLIGYEDPGLVAIGHAMRTYPLLMDLEMRLLLAPKGTEFITSDNPIVMYNKFFGWRTVGSNTGIASKGLAILFPICPFLTLVMFDKDVYHFGGSKSTAVALASQKDVFELNVLQAASATENVYLYSSAANIYKVVDKAIPFRQAKKGIVQVVAENEDAHGKSELIQTSHRDIRTDADISFLRVHKFASRWLREMQAEKYQKAVFLRNEKYMQRFEDHDNAVKAGTAAYEDMITAIYGKGVGDHTF